MSRDCSIKRISTAPPWPIARWNSGTGRTTEASLWQPPPIIARPDKTAIVSESCGGMTARAARAYLSPVLVFDTGRHEWKKLNRRAAKGDAKVAHTFLAEHLIMMRIQSGWFPLCERNPQTIAQHPCGCALRRRLPQAPWGGAEDSRPTEISSACGSMPAQSWVDQA